jgi:transcriptional regulator with XRE-family HTH domain
MATGSDAGLGEIIRHQRELAELSLRQVATMVGISGPYLSQIERGLRLPSSRVLEAIAGSLHISADALSEQARTQAQQSAPQQSADAGTEGSDVVAAIQRDRRLTPNQALAMLEVYAAFTRDH